MTNSIELKKMVQEKYGQLALNSSKDSCCGTSSCCGNSDSNSKISNIMPEGYSELNGYNPSADLGLGCGFPTKDSKIKEGDTVIDLGSGAGNDIFIVRKFVGEKGKVIGLDMTQEMINKAIENNKKLGYENIEFVLGEIENIPLDNEIANAVISNCVLNLVPDKAKAFSEIYRVLKKGGHFSISDIVLDGNLPENIKSIAEAYVGCISGAIQKEEYLSNIEKTGFKNIMVTKENEINIPDEIISAYLTPQEIKDLEESNLKIMSINVYAEK